MKAFFRVSRRSVNFIIQIKATALTTEGIFHEVSCAAVEKM